MTSRHRRIPTLFALAAAAVAAALVLTGCVASPPSAEQIADEFDDGIQPAWTVDVPGIYGDAVVEGDLVAVYAQDDEDGLRLEVHDTATGELLWEHVASPGGSWGSPLFAETESVSRLNPIPAIRPFIVTRGTGDDATPIIIFTERLLTETQELLNDDVLHIADLRTGDLLELTAPDFEELETPYGEAQIDEDGNLIVNAFSPYRICGAGPSVCTEDANGGYYMIDVATLEVTNTTPEWDPSEISRAREWGPGFVNDLDLSDDDTTVSRIEDGEVLWSTASSDLFDNPGTRPAEDRDFIRLGDLMLIQGYVPITPLAGITETLDYDYADSRTLVAVDRGSGEVAWRLPGGDALCFAVDEFALTSETDVVPVCHATAGSFSYSGDGEELLDSVDPEVSIAGVSLADGTIAWEVPHAGDQSILDHGRQLEAVFASGPQVAVVDSGDAVGLVELATGEFDATPKGSGYLCESERDGAKLEFQGSILVSGANPIATEYPAGWYQFPCDQDGGPAQTWTKGAVRAGGQSAADGRVIVVTEDGLAGFVL